MCWPFNCIFHYCFTFLFVGCKKCNPVLCSPSSCSLRKCEGKLFICLSFVGGVILGQIYYYFFLKKIPFPEYIGYFISWGISLLWGTANVLCRQMRCISLLSYPMYCGKPGRGVLKAVVLTFVIAGPITNMVLNAREVVRVFACSTQSAHNLTRKKHQIMAGPFRDSTFTMRGDLEQLKDAFRSVHGVIDLVEKEMEDPSEQLLSRQFNDYVDELFTDQRRSHDVETKYILMPNDTEQQKYQKQFLKKLEYRCQALLSRAVVVCMEAFRGRYERCTKAAGWHKRAANIICRPLKLVCMCNLLPLAGGKDVCDSETQVNPGLGAGYSYLKRAKREIMKNFNKVKLQYKVNEIKELYDVQDATETGSRIMHEFEERRVIMTAVVTAVNFCVALLFLRVVVSAVIYHDRYLTSIGYDNVYITDYFKNIDSRRKLNEQCNLLPLKKMERSKYIDTSSLAYRPEGNKMFTQVLKVMLEMVTATTFVMLDRLFFEALDVVRQHAETKLLLQEGQDLQIHVEGKGMVAGIVRKVFDALNLKTAVKQPVSNRPCLPRPRSMPALYYLKIYGGYLWILLLIYLNPYTLRMRRYICGWFYPRREKQRILHLYNDILKKRLKMGKTLRRNAVQTVRAYYLSGENMLSLRLKFPHLLGWLSIFPAARKKCLICGETEPRKREIFEKYWHSCISPNCPFIYCRECWKEIDEHCIACDPSLADLSDIDSLSDDEHPRD